MIGRATPLTARASAHLDMVRGIAALAVMIGHIRGLFLVDYRDLPSASPVVSLLYAVSGLGHQAVMVFFVLSGFLIGGSVLSSATQWTWKRYLINRLCRLYLVLLPALLFTAVLDYLAYRQPGGHVYFDFPIPHFDPHALNTQRTLSAFFGSMFFLHTIVVPPYGSNTPLWSLANEFWYYMLFPALVLTVYSTNQMKRRLVSLLLVVGMLAFLPVWILTGFLIWLLGVAIYISPILHIARGLRWVLRASTGGAFLATLMLSRVGRIPEAWSDPAVGLSFALWLFCLLNIKTTLVAISPHYQWWAKLFSKSSYSLYAIHFPFVMLIRSSLGTTTWQPTARVLTMGCGLCAGVFLFGLGFSRLTEAHNDVVRKHLLRLFTKRAASQPDLSGYPTKTSA